MDLIYAERIPVINAQRGFGRHVRHDPRSRRFRIPEAQRRQTVVSVQHTSRIGPLDRGSVGQCTGAAALKCLSYDPHYTQLTRRFPAFKWTIETATQLYSMNTQNDSFVGEYPPDDTGSDGLASGETLKKLGWIPGYYHAFGFDDLLTALQTGPVSMGSNWYSSMSTPTSAGQVRITSAAFLEGGHQYCLDGIDVPNQRIWGQQSWGPNWGPLGGRFWMSYATVRRLLEEHGDVISYIPLSEPPPEPAPDPAAKPDRGQELYDHIKVLAAEMGLKV